MSRARTRPRWTRWRALADVDAVAPVATQLGGDIGSLVAVTPAALDALAAGSPTTPSGSEPPRP